MSVASTARVGVCEKFRFLAKHSMKGFYWLNIWALLSGAFSAVSGYEAEKYFRRPVALAWTGDGLLAVANRDAGSVSLIDVAKRKVVGETVVGKKLTDLVALPRGRFLLATDEEKSELVLLEPKGIDLSIIHI